MSTTQRYALIDQDNNILNIISCDTEPPMPVSGEILVRCNENVARKINGWTYKDGEFIAPPPLPVEPQTVPAPTLESIQAQMAALQAQLAQLTAAPTPAPSS